MEDNNEKIENNNEEEKIEMPITKKDPRKVEQGKKLASISKKAKEEKMRRKIKEENFSYLPFIVYPIAFLSSAGFLYLLFFRKREAQEKEEIHYPMTIIRESPKKESPKKKKFESFD